MVKFSILGVNERNKGNAALVKTTMKIIKNFIEDAEFFLMGPRSGFLDRVKIIESHTYGMSLKSPGNVMRAFLMLLKIIIWKKFKIELKFEDRYFRYIQESDIVVNSGGDHLSGEYGRSSIISLTALLYAIFLDKPIVLFSESLGYHSNPLVRRLLDYVLERSDLILLRDAKSYQYVQEHVKTHDEYYLTADPAFLLDPSTDTDINFEGFDKPIIGFNVSPLIAEFAEEIDIVEISIKAIETISERLGGTILLVPHVYGKDSDLKILSQIYNRIDLDNVFLIEDEYEPEELKFIIGNCDLFIGARMHATIASTSMFVPTVGIAYSHKMHGIIGEMLNLQEYVIDLEKLNSEILIEKIMLAWKNREKITEHLRKKIPKIKQKALKNGKLLKKLCDSQLS